jgi:MOSC domain-containing protein YiiM
LTQENINAKVVKLYITKSDTNKSRLDVSKIDVDENGVKGDKFYAKDSDRAILITSTKSYELSKQHGIALFEGALGENILIDANPYHLRPGARIKIGDVQLQITQNCTLCKGLSTLSPKLPKLLKDDRGIFAKVCSNTQGSIHVGDTVCFL